MATQAEREALLIELAREVGGELEINPKYKPRVVQLRPAIEVMQVGDGWSIGYRLDGRWVHLALKPTEERARRETILWEEHRGSHRQGVATCGAFSTEVDEQLVTLLSSLWRRGIWTEMSCQGDDTTRSGYSSFESYADYRRFRRRVRERRPDLVDSLLWQGWDREYPDGSTQKAWRLEFTPILIEDLERVFA